MTIARRSSHNSSNGSLTGLNQSTLLHSQSPRRTPKMLSSTVSKRRSLTSAPNLLRSFGLGCSGKSGDRLQATDKRRRYMRRGSKTSCMLKIPKNLASLECIGGYSPTGDFFSSSNESSATFSVSSSQSSVTNVEALTPRSSEDLVSLALREARRAVRGRQDGARSINADEAVSYREMCPSRVGRSSSTRSSRTTTMSLLTSALALSSVHDADENEECSTRK